jgi:hypothetical protein
MGRRLQLPAPTLLMKYCVTSQRLRISNLKIFNNVMHLALVIVAYITRPAAMLCSANAARRNSHSWRTVSKFEHRVSSEGHQAKQVKHVAQIFR